MKSELKRTLSEHKKFQAEQQLEEAMRRWPVWRIVTAYLCGVGSSLLILYLLNTFVYPDSANTVDLGKVAADIAGDPSFSPNDGLPLTGLHDGGVPAAKTAQGQLPWNTENTGFRAIIPGVLWFYSAFVDERYGTAYTRLHLNCLGSRTLEHKVDCLFATSRPGRYVKVRASDSQTGEETANGKEYSYFLYQCTVPTNLLQYNSFAEKEAMISVTYLTETRIFNATITKSLKVQAPGHTKKYKLVACTNPIYLSKRLFTPQHVIEFMEWHLMAGYQLIVVQNFARLSEIERVLRHYEQLGVVMLLHWDLPVAHDESLFAGKPLAINDCVNRLVGIADYVIIHDNDEFVITKNAATTVPDLLADLFSVDNIACNSFYTNTIKLGVALVDNPFTAVPMTQQNFVLLKQNGFPRSVVRPEMIDLMGTSLPLQCVPPPCQCNTQAVADELFVAQYRTCAETSCVSNYNFTENDIMKRNGPQLLKRLRKATKELGLPLAYDEPENEEQR